MTTNNKAVEAIKTQVAATKTTDIRTLIQQSVKELGKALPSHMSPERLVRIALTTLRLNPELYKCTPESFLGALFQSAQLGLEPNIEGQAYILPFNNRRKVGNDYTTMKEAQFQIGYKGYVELFFRHQSSVSLSMEIVRANDEFDYALGTDGHIQHKPALKDRGEVIGYYAVATLQGGAKVFKFMSKDDCMEHGKKYSKCYDKNKGEFYQYTPWNTNPDAMCLKTVLMQLMKLLPKSIEIQRAMAMDETVKTKVDKEMFAVPDEAEWTEAEKPNGAAEIKTERIPGQEG
jgi:recombination protein RecT